MSARQRQEATVDDPHDVRAVGNDRPFVVLTLRVTDEHHEALRFAGPPFFRPVVAGWIVDSHRLLAPARRSPR